jgi:WD40 repeat protein
VTFDYYKVVLPLSRVMLFVRRCQSMNFGERLVIVGIACVSALAWAQAPVVHPDLVLQTGHGDSVDDLAFSGNGSTLVSHGQDGTIKVWDLGAATLLRSFERDRVSSEARFHEPVSLSAKGDTLLVGRIYGYADEVALADGKAHNGLNPSLGPEAKPTNKFKGPQVTAVAESYDGRWKAVANSDGTILAFDTQRNTAQVVQRTGPTATRIRFMRGAARLLVRRYDNTLIFRDLDRGLGGVIPDLTLSIGADFGFGPNGEIFTVDLEQDQLVVSDLISGANRRTECHCAQVMLSGDGLRLATLEGNPQKYFRLSIWATQDLQPIVAMIPPPLFIRAALSDNGDQVAFGGFDGSVSVLSTKAASRIVPLSGTVRAPTSLQWLSDKVLAVVDSAGGIQVWDLRKGSSRAVFRSGLLAHPSLSSNGRFIIARGKGDTFLLYDFNDGSVKDLGFPATGSIFSLTVSDDGEAVAWSGGSINPADVVDRVIAAVEKIASDPGGKKSNTEDAVATFPLYLAKHTAAGWTTTKVCDSRNQVPVGYFTAQKLNSIGCSASDAAQEAGAGPRFATVSSQYQTVLLAGPKALRVLQGPSRWDTSLATVAPASVATSPDQHWGVVLSDTNIELFDLAKKQSAGKWTPTSPIQIDRIATSGGAPLIAIANDGITFFIDGSGMVQEYSPSGGLISKLVTVGEKTWVVIDSDGRFDTTDVVQVGANLKWRMPDDPLHILPLEIFIRDYYTPQLLPKLLTNQNLPNTPSLAKLNRAQPGVKIIGIQAEPGEPGRVAVTVEVSTQQSTMQKDSMGRFLQSGVFDVHLFRDGQRVGQWPIEAKDELEPVSAGNGLDLWRASHRVKLDSSAKATITFRHVRLPRRPQVRNVEFTAYAFNSDRVKSMTSLPYHYPLPLTQRDPVRRRAYLITMGVNANQAPNLDLDLAVSSAETVRPLLRAKLSVDYQDVIEIQLYSELDDTGRPKLTHASKADFKAVLDLLAGRTTEPRLRDEVDPAHQLEAAGPDDAVVVYVASHGYSDVQGAFYLIPYDTNWKNWGITEPILSGCQTDQSQSDNCKRAEDLLAHSISSSELASWWADIDAGELVMILDSCHSAAAYGKTFRPGPLGDPGFGQLAYDKGMQILSASQPASTEQGQWITGGKGMTLLADTLQTVAEANPQRSLEQWLQDVEDQLPNVTRMLYPSLREEDVQLPLLLDFAKATIDPINP